MDQSIATSKLAADYPGIEGFYFLGVRGEFGYITADGHTHRKETFPQIDDPDFLAQHPHFMEELRHFTHDLNALRVRYLDAHEPDIELGFVRPTDAGEFPWRCATLVLQRDVLDTLNADYDALLSAGVKDPSATSVDHESLQDMRGIQHGLDDLANHADNFGVYHYFPLLFYWPPSMRAGVRGLSPDVAIAPMRVLNLMWRPAESGYGDDAGVARDHGRCSTVYTVLRSNLQVHGAIDRNRRVENRFQIE